MNLFKKDIALYLIADKNIHFRNIYDIPFCLVKHIFNSATDSSIAFCFFKRYSSNSESCCINLCKACIRLGSRSFVNLSMNLFMTPPQFTSSSLQIRLLTESRRFLYSSCIFFFFFQHLDQGTSELRWALDLKQQKALKTRQLNRCRLSIVVTNEEKLQGQPKKRRLLKCLYRQPQYRLKIQFRLFQSFSISERAHETFS